MRVIPTALQAHLNGGATTLCQCWRLVTAANEVFGFTDHDRPLTFESTIFEPDSGFTASEMEASLGLSVNNQDVTGALRSDRLDAARIAAGDFDGAVIETWWVNWQDVTQRIMLRKGTIGEITRGSLGLTAEIRGLSAAFEKPRGRLFQYGCDAVLGDARCGVNLNEVAFVGPGTVISVEDNSRLKASGLGGFASGWFARGTLTWITGANAGRVIEVKSHTLASGIATIDLWQAVPFEIVAGDTFQVSAGCDKQFVTCRNKFANHLRFRGFPHMPGDDFVLSYPKRDDDNDGGDDD
jgi:uncharacterized phage protein (TIGR02218 family)